MDRRPELHRIFKATFDRDPHVYFQPPSNTKISYPCIVYKLSDISAKHANDLGYIEHRSYEVTVIDRDPDSALRERILSLFGDPNQIEWDTHNFESDDVLSDIFSNAKHGGLPILRGRFDRPFINDNLNHYVFTIYY